MNLKSTYSNTHIRKYLTKDEVIILNSVVINYPIDLRVFFLTLLNTGCRISEALELQWDRINFQEKVVVIRCLKKRSQTLYRSVPVPDSMLNMFKELRTFAASDTGVIWNWCRMTAYRHIRSVMRRANLHGAHATPKGLRHSFGVHALQAGVPITLVQRWLGHANVETTAIYTNVVGDEERSIAARMWNNSDATSGSTAEIPTLSATITDDPEAYVTQNFSSNDVLELDPENPDLPGLPAPKDRLENVNTYNVTDENMTLHTCAMLHYWIKRKSNRDIGSCWSCQVSENYRSKTEH